MVHALRLPLLVLALSIGSGACAARAVSAPGPAGVMKAQPEIVTPDQAATRQELRARAERAVLEGRWADAVAGLQILVSAARLDGDPAALGALLYDLGFAFEGSGQRERARDAYHESAALSPFGSGARLALLRAAIIHADLEEWRPLGETADALLARADLDPVDRMSALGARALSRVELGDDRSAMKDVQDGLDQMEALGFGKAGKLPSAAAQLRFAEAEARRIQSERISFIPVTPDFPAKIEARCQGLLDAQNAYADTMRSEDPHWAAMSGYHVGAMYRALHHELVQIPPTPQAKTESDKQLFFAMMHLRYRVLLEKGLEMMKRTSAFASKNPEVLPWARRADEAREEMERAIEDEKAILKTFPYTEVEIQKALDILQEKALKQQQKGRTLTSSVPRATAPPSSPRSSLLAGLRRTS